MKAILNKLRTIAPGRVDIEIDKHILYGETAEQVIVREAKQFGLTTLEVLEKMGQKNSIIRVEVAPITKPMPPAVSYHYDIELALKDCLNQINLWKPNSK